jgi:hypothetical protein
MLAGVRIAINSSGKEGHVLSERPESLGPIIAEQEPS